MRISARVKNPYLYTDTEAAKTKRLGLTLSTCMAFMRSTRPSREVFRISGGVWGGKVSLKCADEYNLHAGMTA